VSRAPIAVRLRQSSFLQGLLGNERFEVGSAYFVRWLDSGPAKLDRDARAVSARRLIPRVQPCCGRLHACNPHSGRPRRRRQDFHGLADVDAISVSRGIDARAEQFLGSSFRKQGRPAVVAGSGSCRQESTGTAARQEAGIVLLPAARDGRMAPGGAGMPEFDWLDPSLGSGCVRSLRRGRCILPARFPAGRY
jgi:hypothetical protein